MAGKRVCQDLTAEWQACVMGPEEMDEIFVQTLTGDYDDESPWEAVRKLHLTGGREVEEKSLMLMIRAATVSDVPLLLRFFHELAEYERKPDAVVIKEETLIRDGFGSQPKFRSLIAEWDGEAVGYAVFFGIYSTLKGSGIFLEDLYVREAFRGRGIGRALLCQVARIARSEGSYGMCWEVLAWNELAIRFYRSLDGKFLDESKQVLLEADALNRLADG